MCDTFPQVADAAPADPGEVGRSHCSRWCRGWRPAGRAAHREYPRATRCPRTQASTWATGDRDSCRLQHLVRRPEEWIGSRDRSPRPRFPVVAVDLHCDDGRRSLWRVSFRASHARCGHRAVDAHAPEPAEKMPAKPPRRGHDPEGAAGGTGESPSSPRSMRAAQPCHKACCCQPLAAQQALSDTDRLRSSSSGRPSAPLGVEPHFPRSLEQSNGPGTLIHIKCKAAPESRPVDTRKTRSVNHRNSTVVPMSVMSACAIKSGRHVNVSTRLTKPRHKFRSSGVTANHLSGGVCSGCPPARFAVDSVGALPTPGSLHWIEDTAANLNRMNNRLDL